MANENKYNLLVVEDDDDLRESVVYFIKRKGYTVHEANSGSKALEVMQSVKVDIVVSDVRMPNGDGVEMLKKIRASNPSIPIVIFATGYADINEAQALELGAFALLDKPVNTERLFSYIDKAVSKLESK